MIWILLSAFAAEPPVDLPDGWTEVSVLDEIGDGLLTGSSAWALRPWGCGAVRLGVDAPDRFEVLRCEGEADGAQLRCVETGELGRFHTGVVEHCTATRDDGTVGAGGVAGGGLHGAPPRLVEHTAERAVWRVAWGAAAEPERVERVVRPCLPGSGVHGGDEGRQECFRSLGVVVRRTPGGPRGRALHAVEEPTPADCRQPCPDNPNAAAVQGANAALAGRWFSEEAADTVRWFATEAACRQAEQARGPAAVPSPCDPAGEPWWATP